MASSTDDVLRADECCSSGIYPFVAQDIERMHELILEDDDYDDANEKGEEYLWFLPRADESKNEFLGRAKIIGDNRRVTQDKKKPPSPVKRAQSLEAVPYTSLSTPSSSQAAAAIVRSSKYGMRSLNMGAGHYRQMVRVSTTTTASSSFFDVESPCSKSPKAQRTAPVGVAHLPTAFRSLLPADNALTQTNIEFTQEQLRDQLQELMSRRYRQFLVQAGLKPDESLLDDIFLSPIDDDISELNSQTVSDALMETDSSQPSETVSTPSAGMTMSSPLVIPSPMSAERQRRARHSTNGQCRTCPGCRSAAPRSSLLSLAAAISSNGSASSAPSLPLPTDRPTSSHCCPCCLHTSAMRSYEWSNSVEMCEDCALPYANFIDDPVAAIIKWRCIDQCKQKLEEQSDAKLCESCHFWLSVDAVRDIIDQTRPPRTVVQNDVIRINRRKQSLPSDSKLNPRSEKTFVPIYESDDVKAFYDSTGPRVRHVCRTSPLSKKARSLSLSFLPLSWRRELQEEEKLRYADETPVESRRQKWYKRGSMYDRGSGRPMANMKSRKESLNRRSAGDVNAFGEIAKKRRRHTSGFEDDLQSSDDFYKPVTSRSASKEAAKAASKTSSHEASVGPQTSDDDRRRKSRSRAPSSPLADEQARHERDRSGSVDRCDALRRQSDPGSADALVADPPPSAESVEPLTPPFDAVKDAMRQCTVTISPLEHKEVYIRLRQREKEHHLLNQNGEHKETAAEHKRPLNGFILINDSGGSDCHSVNGNSQSLLTKLCSGVQKMTKQLVTSADSPVSSNGFVKQLGHQSSLVGDERKLKKTARKTVRSAASKVSAFSPSSISLSPIAAPTRPPLSLRLSTDELTIMDSGAVNAHTLHIEDKLAESAVPKHVELFSSEVRHYAEENERDAQRVPDHHHHRVGELQL